MVVDGVGGRPGGGRSGARHTCEPEDAVERREEPIGATHARLASLAEERGSAGDELVGEGKK